MKKPFALALLAATALLSGSSSLRADAADDVIVAQVGERKITARELERRIAQVPPFQLRSLGRTPDEIRRGFLEKVVIRELLFSMGARDAKLDEREETRERIRGLLRSATLGKLRFDTQSQAPVTDADVKAYYEANGSKFHTPARIAIWRIQVATADDAKKILVEMMQDKSTKHWNDLARDRSLDKLSSMRGGNLGFVMPDGTTSEPGVKVEESLFDAASKVEDGEVVGAPVKDGDRWSIIWRRQSMKSVDRPLDQESVSIRQILQHQRTEEKITAFVERLRQDHLTEYHPELVDLVDVSATGDLQPMRRPGTLPAARHPSAGQPGPKDTQGGGLR